MDSGTSAASRGEIRQEWWVVDATNKVLGRLATRVARVLSGKHRPGYLPYRDTGDFVVVTNADKVLLTGRKTEEKIYRRHTGYPGGLKSVRARDLSATYPERLIEEAVRGGIDLTHAAQTQPSDADEKRNETSKCDSQLEPCGFPAHIFSLPAATFPFVVPAHRDTESAFSEQNRAVPN